MSGASAVDVHALEGVRTLIRRGLPVFIAPPAMKGGVWDPRGGHDNCGYWLPKDWQRTEVDEDLLDRWEPGMAVCGLGGVLLDFLDVDPRNGGDVTARELRDAGLWPRVYAAVSTPSGGWHDYVAPLGVGKPNYKGIDLQGGRPDGLGRGFVFMPPTRKASKVDGSIGVYAWTKEPQT